MPEPLLNTTGGGPSSTQLEAILAVAQPDRVRCDQPHCGRSVYRRIHVVRESGKLLVLGSDCYTERYGTDAASISARYGGGEGRTLTQAERDLLVNNREALLAQFEDEAALSQAAKLKPVPSASPPRPVSVSPQRVVPQQISHETPWTWVKPRTSVLYVKLKDGSGWIRVQRRDDKQLLVPWPVFDGWDEALPPLFGPIDPKCGGHVLPDVVLALTYLRNRAVWESKAARWQDVMAEIFGRNLEDGY